MKQLHNIADNIDKKKIQKKNQKRDVGMVCQKVHKQGRIKVMVNIQSPVPTPLLLRKDVGMDEALYI